MNKHIGIAAISAFIAVALGAFGAHGLKPLLDPDQLAAWHTAVNYQLFHSLALLLLANLSNTLTAKQLNTITTLFTVGIVLFSGSIYGLLLGKIAAVNMNWLGPITPLGGLCLLAAWLYLAIAALKRR